MTLVSSATGRIPRSAPWWRKIQPRAPRDAAGVMSALPPTHQRHAASPTYTKKSHESYHACYCLCCGVFVRRVCAQDSCCVQACGDTILLSFVHDHDGQSERSVMSAAKNDILYKTYVESYRGNILLLT